MGRKKKEEPTLAPADDMELEVETVTDDALTLAEQLAASRAENAAKDKQIAKLNATVSGENLCKFIEFNAPECVEEQWPLCRIQQCSKLQAWWAANEYDNKGNKIVERTNR